MNFEERRETMGVGRVAWGARRWAWLPREEFCFRCGGGGGGGGSAASIGQQYTSMLGALGQGLPTQLQLEGKYTPSELGLGLENLYGELTGYPGGTTTPGTSAGWY